MERWLLISNCQTTGLANAFQMVNPDFEVTPLDIWTFRHDVEGAMARFGEYFRIVVSPEVISTAGFDLGAAPNITIIPNISFSAYHPDCAYAGGSNGMLKGPLDAYHSLIVMAAFRRGLSQGDAEALFRGEFYERCGFMDYWEPQRDRLIDDFALQGFDIQHEVRRWGRRQSFMHTIDHPKIHCLYDVARLVMASMGVPCVEAEILPQDNLTVGSAWAVYPEIGEYLGVEGSYRFKRFGAYRHIGLKQMIAESYALYEREPSGAIHPVAEARSSFARILEAI